MTGRVFLDTNILVYALAVRTNSPVDRRTQIAEELLAGGGVVSVQILNEFVDVATRKLKLGWEELDRSLHAVTVLCGRAASITVDTHMIAVKLSARYSFRVYDSLVVASAIEAGCTTLYTEDLPDGQQIDGLSIANPFLRMA
jgi:predicted nucleic acid-binding protein